MGLKQRSDLHLPRKLWHAIGVLFIVVVYQVVTWRLAIALLVALTAFSVALDLGRRLNPRLNRLVLKTFGPLMRKNEWRGLAGTTYLFAGALVVALIFPKPVATLSLLFLGLGDPISSYFGILYGKDRLIGNKTLQGTLAGFICCTLIALAYFASQKLFSERLLVVSLLSGFIAALAELVPVGRLDDNFTFPLISATALSFIFHGFGAFG